MRLSLILPVLMLALLISNGCTYHESAKERLIIAGGTLVGIGNPGEEPTDKPNGYILIAGDTIAEVSSTERIPAKYKDIPVIDATGTFIMPGLTDGFGVLNNQAYANAYLYMGITTLLEVDGGRRGPYYPDAHPAPDIYRLESVGDDPKDTEAHLRDLDSLYRNGYRVALLKYALEPDQVAALTAHAHELGMVCIGELGHTTYTKAMQMGVDAFVHTTRYSLDLAPHEMAAAVADEPFSDDMHSPKWNYYRYLSSLDTAADVVQDYAARLAASPVFIQPTMSLLYLDVPGHRNPWSFRIAQILDPKDINNPADPETGMHRYPEEVQKNYTAIGIKEFELEQCYHHAGARYLAGSAADVWGTMPGISLHTELQLLHKTGLDNREALAAATANFNKAYGWNCGKIAPGFKAHLLITTENPAEDLENLQNIKILILNGKVIDRESLITTSETEHHE